MRECLELHLKPSRSSFTLVAIIRGLINLKVIEALGLVKEEQTTINKEGKIKTIIRTIPLQPTLIVRGLFWDKQGELKEEPRLLVLSLLISQSYSQSYKEEVPSDIDTYGPLVEGGKRVYDEHGEEIAQLSDSKDRADLWEVARITPGDLIQPNVFSNVFVRYHLLGNALLSFLEDKQLDDKTPLQRELSGIIAEFLNYVKYHIMIKLQLYEALTISWKRGNWAKLKILLENIEKKKNESVILVDRGTKSTRKSDVREIVEQALETTQQRILFATLKDYGRRLTSQEVKVSSRQKSNELHQAMQLLGFSPDQIKDGYAVLLQEAGLSQREIALEYHDRYDAQEWIKDIDDEGIGSSPIFLTEQSLGSDLKNRNLHNRQIGHDAGVVKAVVKSVFSPVLGFGEAQSASSEWTVSSSPSRNQEKWVRHQSYDSIRNSRLKIGILRSDPYASRQSRDPRLTIESGSEADHDFLRISDSGHGIAQEDIQEIWEPYFSKKPLGIRGTGLGLPIVRAAIQQQGARIEVKSEVGMGTTFIIWFPGLGSGYSNLTSFSSPVGHDTPQKSSSPALTAKDIGALIRQYRQKRGLSPFDLGRALNVSAEYILKRIETGRNLLPEGKAVKIGNILNLEIEGRDVSGEEFWEDYVKPIKTEAQSRRIEQKIGRLKTELRLSPIQENHQAHMNLIGGFIRQNRRMKEWYQEELAKRLGVTKALISALETEKQIPSDRFIEKWGGIFGQDSREFLMKHVLPARKESKLRLSEANLAKKSSHENASSPMEYQYLSGFYLTALQIVITLVSVIVLSLVLIASLIYITAVFLSVVIQKFFRRIDEILSRLRLKRGTKPFPGMPGGRKDDFRGEEKTVAPKFVERYISGASVMVEEGIRLVSIRGKGQDTILVEGVWLVPLMETLKIWQQAGLLSSEEKKSLRSLENSLRVMRKHSSASSSPAAGDAFNVERLADIDGFNVGLFDGLLKQAAENISAKLKIAVVANIIGGMRYLSGNRPDIDILLRTEFPRENLEGEFMAVISKIADNSGMNDTIKIQPQPVFVFEGASLTGNAQDSVLGKPLDWHTATFRTPMPWLTFWSMRNALIRPDATIKAWLQAEYWFGDEEIYRQLLNESQQYGLESARVRENDSWQERIKALLMRFGELSTDFSQVAGIVNRQLNRPIQDHKNILKEDGDNGFRGDGISSGVPAERRAESLEQKDASSPMTKDKVEEREIIHGINIIFRYFNGEKIRDQQKAPLRRTISDIHNSSQRLVLNGLKEVIFDFTVPIDERERFRYLAQYDASSKTMTLIPPLEKSKARIDLRRFFPPELMDWFKWTEYYPPHIYKERFNAKNALIKVVGETVKRCPLPQEMRILEVGSGPEGWIKKNSGYVFNGDNYVQLDLSHHFLDSARRQGVGGFYVQANATQLPFQENNFDLIISMDTLHTLTDSELILSMEELNRVLKPDGVFVNFQVFAPNPHRLKKELSERGLICIPESGAFVSEERGGLLRGLEEKYYETGGKKWEVQRQYVIQKSRKDFNIMECFAGKIKKFIENSSLLLVETAKTFHFDVVPYDSHHKSRLTARGEEINLEGNNFFLIADGLESAQKNDIPYMPGDYVMEAAQVRVIIAKKRKDKGILSRLFRMGREGILPEKAVKRVTKEISSGENGQRFIVTWEIEYGYPIKIWASREIAASSSSMTDNSIRGNNRVQALKSKFNRNSSPPTQFVESDLTRRGPPDSSSFWLDGRGFAEGEPSMVSSAVNSSIASSPAGRPQEYFQGPGPISLKERLRRLMDNDGLQILLSKCCPDSQEDPAGRKGLISHFLSVDYEPKNTMFEQVESLSDSEKITLIRKQIEEEKAAESLGATSEAVTLEQILLIQEFDDYLATAHILGRPIQQFAGGQREFDQWFRPRLEEQEDYRQRAVAKWQTVYLLLWAIEIFSRKKVDIQRNNSMSSSSPVENRDDVERLVEEIMIKNLYLILNMFPAFTPIVLPEDFWTPTLQNKLIELREYVKSGFNKEGLILIHNTVSKNREALIDALNSPSGIINLEYVLYDLNLARAMTFGLAGSAGVLLGRPTYDKYFYGRVELYDIVAVIIDPKDVYFLNRVKRDYEFQLYGFYWSFKPEIFGGEPNLAVDLSISVEEQTVIKEIIDKFLVNYQEKVKELALERKDDLIFHLKQAVILYIWMDKISKAMADRGGILSQAAFFSSAINRRSSSPALPRDNIFANRIFAASIRRVKPGDEIAEEFKQFVLASGLFTTRHTEIIYELEKQVIVFGEEEKKNFLLAILKLIFEYRDGENQEFKLPETYITGLRRDFILAGFYIQDGNMVKSDPNSVAWSIAKSLFQGGVKIASFDEGFWADSGIKKVLNSFGAAVEDFLDDSFDKLKHKIRLHLMNLQLAGGSSPLIIERREGYDVYRLQQSNAGVNTGIGVVPGIGFTIIDFYYGRDKRRINLLREPPPNIYALYENEPDIYRNDLVFEPRKTRISWIDFEMNFEVNDYRASSSIVELPKQEQGVVSEISLWLKKIEELDLSPDQIGNILWGFGLEPFYYQHSDSSMQAVYGLEGVLTIKNKMQKFGQFNGEHLLKWDYVNYLTYLMKGVKEADTESYGLITALSKKIEETEDVGKKDRLFVNAGTTIVSALNDILIKKVKEVIPRKKQETFVDLHMHSLYSDGRESIGLILYLSYLRDLSVITISDHLAFSGVYKAVELGKKWGITVIPSVEIPTGINKDGVITENRDILVYFPDAAKFKEWYERGLDEQTKIIFEQTQWGYSSLSGIVAWAEERGGVSVLAHPGRYGYQKESWQIRDDWYLLPVEEIFPAFEDFFVRTGLRGIEIIHPTISFEQTKQYFRLIQEYNQRHPENKIIFTVGSDSHSGEGIGLECNLNRELVELIRSEIGLDENSDVSEAILQQFQEAKHKEARRKNRIYNYTYPLTSNIILIRNDVFESASGGKDAQGYVMPDLEDEIFEEGAKEAFKEITQSISGLSLLSISEQEEIKNLLFRKGRIWIKGSAARDADRLKLILKHELLQRRIIFDKDNKSLLQDAHNIIMSDGSLAFAIYALCRSFGYGFPLEMAEFWTQWVFPSGGCCFEHKYMRDAVKKKVNESRTEFAKVNEAIKLVDILTYRVERELQVLIPKTRASIKDCPFVSSSSSAIGFPVEFSKIQTGYGRRELLPEFQRDYNRRGQPQPVPTCKINYFATSSPAVNSADAETTQFFLIKWYPPAISSSPIGEVSPSADSPAERKFRITIPDLKKIRGKRIIGGFSESLNEDSSQSRVPYDSHLLEKFGIEKGEGVFGFAGYIGDWLGALSNLGARVVYTDIDPVIVEWVARKNRAEPFEEIRIGDPLDEPASVNLYDWSFSYESFPLEPYEWPLVLLRSMFNRKGLIWVSSVGDTGTTLKQLKGFADIYGLKGRTDPEEGQEFTEFKDEDIQKRLVFIISASRAIDKKRQEKFANPFPFLVLTVKTNDSLRLLAERDISVIGALQSFKEKSQEEELYRYLAGEGISIDRNPLLESLSRITKLSLLCPSDIQKEIEVRLDSDNSSSPISDSFVKKAKKIRLLLKTKWESFKVMPMEVYYPRAFPYFLRPLLDFGFNPIERILLLLVGRYKQKMFAGIFKLNLKLAALDLILMARKRYKIGKTAEERLEYINVLQGKRYTPRDIECLLCLLLDEYSSVQIAVVKALEEVPLEYLKGRLGEEILEALAATASIGDLFLDPRQTFDATHPDTQKEAQKVLEKLLQRLSEEAGSPPAASSSPIRKRNPPIAFSDNVPPIAQMYFEMALKRKQFSDILSEAGISKEEITQMHIRYIPATGNNKDLFKLIVYLLDGKEMRMAVRTSWLINEPLLGFHNLDEELEAIDIISNSHVRQFIPRHYGHLRFGKTALLNKRVWMLFDQWIEGRTLSQLKESEREKFIIWVKKALEIYLNHIVALEVWDRVDFGLDDIMVVEKSGVEDRIVFVDMGNVSSGDSSQCILELYFMIYEEIMSYQEYFRIVWDSKWKDALIVLRKELEKDYRFVGLAEPDLYFWGEEAIRQRHREASRELDNFLSSVSSSPMRTTKTTAQDPEISKTSSPAKRNILQAKGLSFEELQKLLNIHLGVFDNTLEGPAVNLSVVRNNQCNLFYGMKKFNMASALANSGIASPQKSVDNLVARKQGRLHMARLRILWDEVGRTSLGLGSKYNSTASLIFLRASFSDLPWLWQPGNEGALATIYPSWPFSNTILSLIILTSVVRYNLFIIRSQEYFISNPISSSPAEVIRNKEGESFWDVVNRDEEVQQETIEYVNLKTEQGEGILLIDYIKMIILGDRRVYDEEQLAQLETLKSLSNEELEERYKNVMTVSTTIKDMVRSITRDPVVWLRHYTVHAAVGMMDGIWRQSFDDGDMPEEEYREKIQHSNLQKTIFAEIIRRWAASSPVELEWNRIVTIVAEKLRTQIQIGDVRNYLRRDEIAFWDKQEERIRFATIESYAGEVVPNINELIPEGIDWKQFAISVWKELRLDGAQLWEAINRALDKQQEALKDVPVVREFDKAFPGTVLRSDLLNDLTLPSIDEARRIRSELQKRLNKLLLDFEESVEQPARKLVMQVINAGYVPWYSNAYGPGIKGVIFMKEDNGFENEEYFTSLARGPEKYFIPLTPGDYHGEDMVRETLFPIRDNFHTSSPIEAEKIINILKPFLSEKPRRMPLFGELIEISGTSELDFYPDLINRRWEVMTHRREVVRGEISLHAATGNSFLLLADALAGKMVIGTDLNKQSMRRIMTISENISGEVDSSGGSIEFRNMDVRSLKDYFEENSIDHLTITNFFNIVLLEFEDKIKIYEDIYKVVRQGGTITVSEEMERDFGIILERAGIKFEKQDLGAGTENIYFFIFHILEKPNATNSDVTLVSSPLIINTKRIIYADDDEFIRPMIAESLQRRGFTVYEAANGRGAWEILLRFSQVDLVITDYIMPVMHGVELLENMAKEERLKKIPVIIITGGSKTDLERRLSSLNLKQVVVLAKPFENKEIVDAVKKIIPMDERKWEPSPEETAKERQKIIEGLYSLKNDYSNEIPPDEVSGVFEYKVQSFWWSRLLLELDLIISYSLINSDELLEQVNKFREIIKNHTYKIRAKSGEYLTNPEYIPLADDLIDEVLREIGGDKSASIPASSPAESYLHNIIERSISLDDFPIARYGKILQQHYLFVTVSSSISYEGCPQMPSVASAEENSEETASSSVDLSGGLNDATFSYLKEHTELLIRKLKMFAEALRKAPQGLTSEEYIQNVFKEKLSDALLKVYDIELQWLAAIQVLKPYIIYPAIGEDVLPLQYAKQVLGIDHDVSEVNIAKTYQEIIQPCLKTQIETEDLLLHLTISHIELRSWDYDYTEPLINVIADFLEQAHRDNRATIFLKGLSEFVSQSDFLGFVATFQNMLLAGDTIIFFGRDRELSYHFLDFGFGDYFWQEDRFQRFPQAAAILNELNSILSYEEFIWKRILSRNRGGKILLLGRPFTVLIKQPLPQTPASSHSSSPAEGSSNIQHPFFTVPISGRSEKERENVRRWLIEMAPIIPPQHTQPLRLIRIGRLLPWSGMYSRFRKGRISILVQEEAQTKKVILHELGHLVYYEIPQYKRIWSLRNPWGHIKYLIFYNVICQFAPILLMSWIMNWLLGDFWKMDLSQIPNEIILYSAVVFFGSIYLLRFLFKEFIMPKVIFRGLFVSAYAMTNKAEDFAESYMFYPLHKEKFLNLTQVNSGARSKFEAIQEIFETSSQDLDSNAVSSPLKNNQRADELIRFLSDLYDSEDVVDRVGEDILPIFAEILQLMLPEEDRIDTDRMIEDYLIGHNIDNEYRKKRKASVYRASEYKFFEARGILLALEEFGFINNIQIETHLDGYIYVQGQKSFSLNNEENKITSSPILYRKENAFSFNLDIIVSLFSEADFLLARVPKDTVANARIIKPAQVEYISCPPKSIKIEIVNLSNAKVLYSQLQWFHKSGYEKLALFPPLKQEIIIYDGLLISSFERTAGEDGIIKLNRILLSDEVRWNYTRVFSIRHETDHENNIEEKVVKDDIIFFATLDSRIRNSIISDLESIDKSESWGVGGKPYTKTLELLHFVNNLMEKIEFDEFLDLVNIMGSAISTQAIFKALVSGKLKENLDTVIKVLDDKGLLGAKWPQSETAKKIPSKLKEMGVTCRLTSKGSSVYATPYLRLESPRKGMMVMKGKIKEKKLSIPTAYEIRLVRRGSNSRLAEKAATRRNIITIDIDRLSFNRIVAASIDYLNNKNLGCAFLKLAWIEENTENGEFYIVIKPNNGNIKMFRIGDRSIYEFFGITKEDILRKARLRSWHTTKEELAPPNYPAFNLVENEIRKLADEAFFNKIKEWKKGGIDSSILEKSDPIAFEILKAEQRRFGDGYFLILNELTAKDSIYNIEP